MLTSNEDFSLTQIGGDAWTVDTSKRAFIKTLALMLLWPSALTSCTPNLSKLEYEIVDETEQAKNDLRTLKELNRQYKSLQEVIKTKDKKDPRDSEEIRELRTKIEKKKEEMKTRLQKIKDLRTKFTDAGGKIGSIWTYPNFDNTIAWLELELKGINID